MILKREITNLIATMMGSMILMYGAAAYGGSNEEPKTKSETETMEKIGTYPLRGGETPSVEYGQHIKLSENVSLQPFVELTENLSYDHAWRLVCPKFPGEMLGTQKRVVGTGSELEIKLEDKVSVYGRGEFGRNGNFYAPEEKNPGNSFEFGGGVKFDFELFGKDIKLNLEGSYNNQFGPMTTGGFSIYF